MHLASHVVPGQVNVLMAYSPQYSGGYATPSPAGGSYGVPVAGGAGAGAGAGGMDWLQAQQYQARQAQMHQAAQAQAYARQYAATPDSGGSGYYGSPDAARGQIATQQAHQRALAVAAAAVARGEARASPSTPVQPMQVRPGPDGSYGAGARVATPLGFDREFNGVAPPPPPLIGSPLARGASAGHTDGDDEASVLRGKLERANERIAEKDRRLQQALADQDALTSKVRHGYVCVHVALGGVGGGLWRACAVAGVRWCSRGSPLLRARCLPPVLCQRHQLLTGTGDASTAALQTALAERTQELEATKAQLAVRAVVL